MFINFLIASGILFWVIVFIAVLLFLSAWVEKPKTFKSGVEDRILSLLTYEIRTGRYLFDCLEEEGYMPSNNRSDGWVVAFYHLMGKMEEDGLVIHEDRVKDVCGVDIKERRYSRLWITQ